jgi:hypothetical protein
VLNVDTNSLAGISSAGISSIGGAGTLNTNATTLDLSNQSVGTAITSGNVAGTMFTVTDANTASHVVGGVGNDTLVAQGFTFTADQRNAIFAQSSVEVLQDASGEYGGSGDNILKAYVAGIMTGGSGADSFVFNQSNLGLNIITDFASGSDHLDISASGLGGGLILGGTPTVLTVADASSASNLGSNGYFIFDNAGANAGTLYWDSTGGSSADAIPLAILTGVNSVLVSDFHLV